MEDSNEFIVKSLLLFFVIVKYEFFSMAYPVDFVRKNDKGNTIERL